MRPQLADDATPPRRMNWLTASMFAKKFRIHVRRAIWTGEEGKPALKWVYYASGLWKVFLSESGQTVTRVVNGQTLGEADAVLVTADITLSDLQATDWTALSVDCETELGPQKCPCASEEYLKLYAMSLTPGVDATKDKLDFANPNLTKVECRDDSTGGTGTDGTGTDGTGTDGTGTDGNGTDGNGNPTTGGPGTSLGGPNGPSGGNNEYTPLSGPGGPNGGGGGDPDAPGGGGGPIGGPTGPPGPPDETPPPPVKPVLGRSLTLGAVQTDLPDCLPLGPGGSDPENPHPVTVEGCTISLEDTKTPNQLWFVKAYFRGATVFNSVMKNGDTADVTMGDKASFKMIWGASAQVTANAWASNKPDIVADPSSFTMPEPCEPTPTPTPPVPTPTPTPPSTSTPTPTPTPTPTSTPPPSPTPTAPPTPTPPGFTPTPTPTPPAPTPTPTPTPP